MRDNSSCSTESDAWSNLAKSAKVLEDIDKVNFRIVSTLIHEDGWSQNATSAIDVACPTTSTSSDGCLSPTTSSTPPLSRCANPSSAKQMRSTSKIFNFLHDSNKWFITLRLSSIRLPSLTSVNDGRHSTWSWMAAPKASGSRCHAISMQGEWLISNRRRLCSERRSDGRVGSFVNHSRVYIPSLR